MNDSRIFKVGIDLTPAELTERSPGTARLVKEQARALFKLDVPWQWVPVFARKANPLFDEVAQLQPRLGRGRKFSLHTTFDLGPIWQQAGCDLGFATAYFSPLTGPPVVANYFDANSYEPIDAWHRRRRAVRHLWTNLLVRHTLHRAKALFILSNYGHERLSSLFPRHEHKIHVTPCGFTAPGLAPAHPPAWASDLKKPYFLFVGSFSDNKNQRTLLAAWRMLQEQFADAPALVLIGPTPAAYRREVLDPLMAALPRSHEVLLPGFAPDAELAWAYHHALGYVQPSFAEGCGMPILEAMSCGLPVACSNTTCLPETAGGAALLFDPKSASTLVDAITRLWKDAPLRTHLSVAGRDQASQFSWTKNARLVAEEIDRQLHTNAKRKL